MSNATLAGLRKGNRELEAAVKAAMAVFGEPLSLSCGSHNGRDFHSFKAYAKDSVWAEHATRAFVSVESLMDYGRPKHITPQMWVWVSSFVSVTLEAAYPFNIYWHEPGHCDEHGKITRKSGLRPFAMSVKVSGGRKYGLGDWTTKRVGLLEWAATFKDDKTRAALQEGVANADREVERWKAGMAEMAASVAAIK